MAVGTHNLYNSSVICHQCSFFDYIIQTWSICIHNIHTDYFLTTYGVRTRVLRRNRSKLLSVLCGISLLRCTVGLLKYCACFVPIRHCPIYALW